jgi:hypothetical protein
VVPKDRHRRERSEQADDGRGERRPGDLPAEAPPTAAQPGEVPTPPAEAPPATPPTPA